MALLVISPADSRAKAKGQRQKPLTVEDVAGIILNSESRTNLTSNDQIMHSQKDKPSVLSSSRTTPGDGAEVLKGKKLIAGMKKVCKDTSDSANGSQNSIDLHLLEPKNKTMKVKCSEVERKGSSRACCWW